MNTYEPLFTPFALEVQRIQQALLRGDIEGMKSAVSDEMIDTFAVAGRPDEVRARLAPYLELADSICLTPPDQLISPEETARYRDALIEAFAD